MYGLFQTAFYFGYMALFSGALGIMCGTVGYTGASIFVRKIYSTVKIDWSVGNATTVHSNFLLIGEYLFTNFRINKGIEINDSW